MATLTERHHTLGHRVLFGAGPRCLIQATSPSLTVLSGLQFPSPASRLRKARSMDRLGQCFRPSRGQGSQGEKPAKSDVRPGNGVGLAQVTVDNSRLRGQAAWF